MKRLMIAALCVTLAGCATLRSAERSLEEPRTSAIDLACGGAISVDPTLIVAAGLCGAALIYRGVLWLLDHPQPSVPAPAPQEEEVVR